MWVVAPFNDRFLRACRREPVDATPVWFMRQAGRYLPEYRELRGDRDILQTCREPELAVEITLQPLRRMDLDAAILFSDIMVPLAGVGVDVRIESGVGPVIDTPVRSADDVARLRLLEPERDVPEVLEAIRLLRKELSVPLIGFAGAPFTLASYLIEGGPSRTHERAKAMMFGDPGSWNSLMTILASIVQAHLRAQVAAGAQALQVFDSWVGALAPEDYARCVFPTMHSLFAGLADLGVPLIHFGVGTGELLGQMRRAGGDVIGIDWKTPLDVGWERVGPGVGVQGNLDPTSVLAPWDVVEDRARAVLHRADARPGHVFNLGHGVLPSTSPDTLARLVDLVHQETTIGATDRPQEEPTG
ncbi:MAG: uroporphyrinogen decarboxylase [Actinomycetota bacterium]